MFSRGEAHRMLLNHAGVAFEDERIGASYEEWGKYKPLMPGGQVPALEFSKTGKKMGQSRSMLRYLGRKFGYYPKDPLLAY